MYGQVTEALRAAYDQTAEARNTREIPSWKQGERQAFLQLLQAEGKRSLLEVGAGPGRDSRYFQHGGLQVVSTDLSPEMVRLCREKGLEAYVMDFLHLDFADGRFDAVYALNCLLHVPKGVLPQALREIRRVLKPGGLFFYGVYGGFDHEGIWEDDKSVPKRFFALYGDESIQRVAGQTFLVRDFKTIELPEDRSGMHFQRMILEAAWPVELAATRLPEPA